jgi:hypothetical protein
MQRPGSLSNAVGLCCESDWDFHFNIPDDPCKMCILAQIFHWCDWGRDISIQRIHAMRSVRKSCLARHPISSHVAAWLPIARGLFVVAGTCITRYSGYLLHIFVIARHPTTATHTMVYDMHGFGPGAIVTFCAIDRPRISANCGQVFLWGCMCHSKAKMTLVHMRGAK